MAVGTVCDCDAWRRQLPSRAAGGSPVPDPGRGLPAAVAHNLDMIVPENARLISVGRRNSSGQAGRHNGRCSDLDDLGSANCRDLRWSRRTLVVRLVRDGKGLTGTRQ